MFTHVQQDLRLLGEAHDRVAATCRATVSADTQAEGLLNDSLENFRSDVRESLSREIALALSKFRTELELEHTKRYAAHEGRMRDLGRRLTAMRAELSGTTTQLLGLIQNVESYKVGLTDVVLDVGRLKVTLEDRDTSAPANLGPPAFSASTHFHSSTMILPDPAPPSPPAMHAGSSRFAGAMSPSTPARIVPSAPSPATHATAAPVHVSPESGLVPPAPLPALTTPPAPPSPPPVSRQGVVRMGEVKWVRGDTLVPAIRIIAAGVFQGQDRRPGVIRAAKVDHRNEKYAFLYFRSLEDAEWFVQRWNGGAPRASTWDAVTITLERSHK